jgi:hypothetical protein
VTGFVRLLDERADRTNVEQMLSGKAWHLRLPGSSRRS